MYFGSVPHDDTFEFHEIFRKRNRTCDIFLNISSYESFLIKGVEHFIGKNMKNQENIFFHYYYFGPI